MSPRGERSVTGRCTFLHQTTRALWFASPVAGDRSAAPGPDAVPVSARQPPDPVEQPDPVEPEEQAAPERKAAPEEQAAPEPLDEQDLRLVAAVGLAEDDVTDLQRKVLARMSPRTKDVLLWMAGHWPGRITFRMATGIRHLQIFDRAMTVAAQMFTSVFPIIIMTASILGGRNASQAISGNALPPDAENVLDDVVSSSGFGAFGLIGVLVVLISATSLSRALTRAYDNIWRHGKTKIPPRQAWRWLAAVFVLAAAVVGSHTLDNLATKVPPPGFWSTFVVFGVPTFVACFIPWMLMAGRVPPRLLLPGAIIFGLVLLLAHPFSTHYLSTSIAVSADRFGPIGVAFSYLTYLYCVSWVLLAAAVLGRVIVIDPGLVGRLIRGRLTIDERGKVQDDGGTGGMRWRRQAQPNE
jgi:membrane protein